VAVTGSIEAGPPVSAARLGGGTVTEDAPLEDPITIEEVPAWDPVLDGYWDEAATRHQRDLIEPALVTLEEPDQRLVRLFLGGATRTQIAHEYGVSRQAMTGRLNRIFAELRMAIVLQAWAARPRGTRAILARLEECLPGDDAPTEDADTPTDDDTPTADGDTLTEDDLAAVAEVIASLRRNLATRPS
jgi:hypothetical protein